MTEQSPDAAQAAPASAVSDRAPTSICPSEASIATTVAQYDLIWDVSLSALYHQKRERFLDGIDRFSQTISVLAGAAAFARLMETSKDGLSIPAAIVAVVGTLTLCYGPSVKARRHAELARDFKKLHAEIINAGPAMTSKMCARFQAEFRLLEANEPASLGALVRQCENELATSRGCVEDVIPLTFLQRRFRNVFDFDMSQSRDFR